MGTEAIQGNGADSMQLIAEQRRLNQENFANSMAMMQLQQEQHKQQEAIAALSNMMKNAHDSSMLVINNAKG